MTKIIICNTNNGKTKLEVTLEDETLWLNQKQIVELYQKSKSTISEHIKHIFEEEELARDSVVRNFRTTASDGKNYDVDYYNLKPNMGLTSWRRDEIRSTDATIAKNYLKEDEIEELNRIVSMWLDFAEDQAKRRKQIFLKDWQEKLDSFLAFNGRDILPNAGKISKKEADKKAKDEYRKFSAKRREEKERLGSIESIKALEQIAKNRDKK